MTELRCLTIRQPWASLLVDPTLPKTIETRSRRTNVRGTIGIIAGKWVHSDCVLDIGDYESVKTYHRGGPFAGLLLEPILAELPLGALIGTVDLYDCIPIVSERDCVSAPDCPEGMIAVAGPASGFEGHLTWLTWKHTYYGRGRHIDKERTVEAEAQRPYGNFVPGGWAWLTRNPVLFDEPVPMAGSQGWKIINR